MPSVLCNIFFVVHLTALPTFTVWGHAAVWSSRLEPAAFERIHPGAMQPVANSIHSLIRSLIQSLTHPLAHPLMHSLVHSLMTYCLLAHNLPLARSLNHSLTHSLIRSLTHASINSLSRSLARSLAHIFTQPLTRLSTHSLIQLLARWLSCTVMHSITYLPTHSVMLVVTHSLTHSLIQRGSLPIGLVCTALSSTVRGLICQCIMRSHGQVLIFGLGLVLTVPCVIRVRPLLAYLSLAINE